MARGAAGAVGLLNCSLRPGAAGCLLGGADTAAAGSASAGWAGAAGAGLLGLVTRAGALAWYLAWRLPGLAAGVSSGSWRRAGGGGATGAAASSSSSKTPSAPWSAPVSAPWAPEAMGARREDGVVASNERGLSNGTGFDVTAVVRLAPDGLSGERVGATRAATRSFMFCGARSAPGGAWATFLEATLQQLSPEGPNAQPSETKSGAAVGKQPRARARMEG